MALTELTKVTGPGIHTLSNVLSHNIKSSGIITATKFSGPLDSIGGNFAGVITATNGVFSGNISAVDGNFSGNVTIGGTLTYEDVTNIDSVGIITARDGLKILGGGANIVGVVTATGADINGDLDVDGHTNLDNVSIAGVTTFSSSVHVSGDLDVASDIRHIGDTDTRLRFETDTISARTAGSERLRITSGGNVGIATNNPQSLLHLHGTGGSGSGIRFDNSHDTLSQYFTNDANDSDFLITYNGTGGAELTIHADGNLGLNESNGDNVFIGTNASIGDAKLSISKAGSGITTAIGLSNGSGTGSRIMSSRSLVLSADTENDSGGGQSYLGFETDGTEKVRINSAGRLLMGHDTNQNDFHGPQTTINRNPHFQLHGTNTSSAGAALISWSSSGGAYYSPTLFLARSGSNTKGTNGILPSDTTLGNIVFSGDDGTDFVKGAMIVADVDGTPGDNDMPGRLEFYTTPSGAQVPVERLRINSSGRVSIGNLASPDGNLHVYNSTSGSVTAASDANQLVLESTANVGMSFLTANNSISRIKFGDTTATNRGIFYFDHSTTSFNFQYTSSLKLTIDSSGHILPGASGTQDLGSTSKEWGDLYFANSKGLKLGSSQVGDLYNDGTDTYFRNSVSNGQTLIRSGGNIWISDYSGNHRAAFRDNSSVDLYFDIENNATAKLSTTVKGISVHGEVAASQDYPNIQPTLDFNFAAVKKLDPRITYTRTGTASFINEFGKMVIVGDNAPRFDHDPTTKESKGLLIEESRINQWLYSEDIATYITGGNLQQSILTNTTATTDPTGGTDAVLQAADTNGGAHSIFKNFTSGSNGDVHTFSIWVKAAGVDYARIYVDTVGGNLNGPGVTFSTGNVWSIAASGVGTQFATSAVEYPNGWWRLSVTGSFSNRNDFYCHIDIEGGEGDVSYTGNGSNGIYIWGAQFEKGKFPTSYIPTNGSTATRGNESFEIDGEDFTDFYNTTEGTVLSHITPLDGSLGNHSGTGGVVWSFDAGGGFANGHYFSNANSTTAFGHSVVVGSSGQNTGGGTGNQTNGVPFKNATIFKKDDFIMATNGTLASADTSGNLPTVVKLMLGNNGWSNDLNAANIHFNRFAYYPKRLPNTQLRNLTS